jgi:HK97 family phage portal protein
MFGLISKTKAATFFANTLKQIALSSYTIPTTGLLVYGTGNPYAQIQAYVNLDDLYAIVNKIDSCCKQIPLFVYNVTDEKKFRQYRLIAKKIRNSKNYSRKAINDLQELQYKSLEIAGDGDPLQMLIDTPNQTESKDEFYSALYTFPLLTGNDYIVMNKYKVGIDEGKPYEMFHINPAFVEIIPSNTLPRSITQYIYSLYTYNMTFENTDILHRKYFNPVYSYSGQELYGLSPLQAALPLLNQIKNERDYAVRSLMNAGAEGFLNNEDAEFDVETFGSVKNDILKELGATRDRNGSNLNAKKLAVLLGKWKYNQIGINPADMELNEQSKISFKKLCNIYGVSDRLFNNDATGSEVSIDRMLRDAFMSVAIPEVAAVCDLFNRGLTPYFNDGKTEKFIDYDITDVTQIQEDINSVITRFSNAPAFRVNDLFEATGWGRLDDPNADVVLVKQGYETLSDATSTFNADLTALDNAGLNNYNKPGQ